jgi:hypothetical protein
VQFYTFQYNVDHMERISLLKTTQFESYSTVGRVSVFVDSRQKPLAPTDNRTPAIKPTAVTIPTELSQLKKIIV